MRAHANLTKHDDTLPLPQDTAAPIASEDAQEYRELRLRDGASVFVPIADDSAPTD
jgi:hypothetical protein